MECHGQSRAIMDYNTMDGHGVSWAIIGCHSLSWISMVYYGRSCSAMIIEYHGRSWSAMIIEYHGQS